MKNLVNLPNTMIDFLKTHKISKDFQLGIQMINLVNGYLSEYHNLGGSLSDIVFYGGSQIQHFVIENQRKYAGIAIAQAETTSKSKSSELVEVIAVDT